MEPKTLRTEVEALRRIFDDDGHPWLALDRGVRSTICAMLDIALRSPDTAHRRDATEGGRYDNLGSSGSDQG